MIHRSAHRTPRARRWRARLGLGAAGVCCVLLATGTAHGAPSPTGPTGPGPSGGTGEAPVACLDQRLRPAERCPSVDAEVTVTLDGDDLLVSVANAGEAAWPGGPVAVELPVRDADVDQPDGRDDPTGRAGTAEWTTRAGTVVSRCVFEPVAQLRSGADLTCRLHRLGLPDGTHQLWLTGFVGGLPPIRGALGDAPPLVGVVPVATPRSVGFRIVGDRVVVIEATSPAGSDGAADDVDEPSEPSESPLPVLVALVAAAAVGAGAAAFVRHRRRD